MSTSLDRQEHASPAREEGVFRKSLGTYTVHSEGEVAQCAISSKLRKHLGYQ